MKASQTLVVPSSGTMMTTGADDGWWHLVTTVMKAAGPPVSLRMIILQINSTVSLDTWIIAFWLQLHVESAVYSPWNSLNSVSIRSDTPLFLPSTLSLSLSLPISARWMESFYTLHPTRRVADSSGLFSTLTRVPAESRRSLGGLNRWNQVWIGIWNSSRLPVHSFHLRLSYT